MGALERLVTLLAALEGMLDEAVRIMAEAAAPLDGALAVGATSGVAGSSTPEEVAAAAAAGDSGGGGGVANGGLLPAFRLVYGQVAAACAAYSQLLASGQVGRWAGRSAALVFHAALASRNARRPTPQVSPAAIGAADPWRWQQRRAQLDSLLASGVRGYLLRQRLHPGGPLVLARAQALRGLMFCWALTGGVLEAMLQLQEAVEALAAPAGPAPQQQQRGYGLGQRADQPQPQQQGGAAAKAGGQAGAEQRPQRRWLPQPLAAHLAFLRPMGSLIVGQAALANLAATLAALPQALAHTRATLHSRRFQAGAKYWAALACLLVTTGAAALAQPLQLLLQSLPRGPRLRPLQDLASQGALRCRRCWCWPWATCRPRCARSSRLTASWPAASPCPSGWRWALASPHSTCHLPLSKRHLPAGAAEAVPLTAAPARRPPCPRSRCGWAAPWWAAPWASSP